MFILPNIYFTEFYSIVYTHVAAEKAFKQECMRAAMLMWWMEGRDSTSCKHFSAQKTLNQEFLDDRYTII